jgi:hypothetical protein
VQSDGKLGIDMASSARRRTPSARIRPAPSDLREPDKKKLADALQKTLQVARCLPIARLNRTAPTCDGWLGQQR